MAQAVGTEFSRVHSHETHVSFDDEGDGLVGDTGLTDVMAFCETAEDRSRRNSTEVQPVLQCADGTEVFILDIGDGDGLPLVELVCFGFAQRDEKAKAVEVQVLYIQPGDFGTAHGAIKTDEEHGLIPGLPELIAVEITEHFPDVIEQDGSFSVLLGSFHALDATDGVFYDREAAGVIFDAGSGEVFRQGRDAAGNRIGLGVVCQVVDIIDNRFR